MDRAGDRQKPALKAPVVSLSEDSPRHTLTTPLLEEAPKRNGIAYFRSMYVQSDPKDARLLTTHGSREQGGPMSYGPNFSDRLRGAADDVDKILHGQNRATSRSINPLSLTSPKHRCHGSAEPPHGRTHRPSPAFRLGPVRWTRSAPLLGTLGRGVETLLP
jgi:hypothetical protein